MWSHVDVGSMGDTTHLVERAFEQDVKGRSEEQRELVPRFCHARATTICCALPLATVLHPKPVLHLVLKVAESVHLRSFGGLLSFQLSPEETKRIGLGHSLILYSEELHVIVSLLGSLASAVIST